MPVSLGPVIGKVGGGAEIHRIDIPDFSTGGSDRVLASIPAPEGKEIVVTFSATNTGGVGATYGNYPGIAINGNDLTGTVRNLSPRANNCSLGGTLETVGPATVELIASSSNGTFTMRNFTVYWWEVD